MEERRYKLLTLTERDILSAVIPHPTGEEIYLLVRKTIIPEGYEIRGVYYDFRIRAFVFAVYHPSFEIVPDGCNIPELNNGEQWAQIFTVKK